MPIFWWYLLKNYLNVLLLSLFSFVAILLISRLEEIAQFAAMGAKFSYLIIFTLYQIPYILPIAIPISCLISAMILFQRLSSTHEFTALRSCGIALSRIITPILLASLFLSVGCFYITSEMATSSHLATRKMAYDLSSVNPILLLQSAKIARLQDAFIQMDPVRNVEVAQNLVIALNNRSGKRLNLCIAKQIEMEGDKLLAKHVSIISSAPAENSFDHLVIENQQLMTSSAPEIVKLLHKTGWRIANDHLTFSLLRIRTKLLQEQVALYHKQAHSPETQCVPARGIDEKAIRNLSKCYTEYVRRFSVGLSTFTFTLLGIAFGITIGRNRTKRDILIVLGISACCLIAFCLGKELAHLFWIASLFFLLPHALIILASLWSIRKVQRGIE